MRDIENMSKKIISVILYFNLTKAFNHNLSRILTDFGIRGVSIDL